MTHVGIKKVCRRLFFGVPFVILFFCQCKEESPRQASLNEISPDSTDELWYKNSIIYTLDIEVFKDSDGDGTGDLDGLTQKLGYIDSLGVDAIWLAPFQPTPNKDDGYDVSDYYTVDSRLGNMEDFREMIQSANEKGLRIMMDLVVNHTSKEHPWFKQARQSSNSPYRSWYVWSKERPQNYDIGMVFPGVQKTTWTLDSVAREYYYHRFYSFQPDLNAQNPSVQAEVQKIIKHWVNLGVSGFRLDGVPFFIEVTKTEGDKFEYQYELLAKMRAYLQSLRKDAIVLGEANVLPEENENYFGKTGNGMHMMFNFFVNQHLFYALATGEAKPLREALKATAEIPRNAQWGQFLRNHDEVDLGRLTDRERDEVYKAFGPEKNMQLYERGIRRRLAPMMQNNREHLELAYSVLFSLPSTPVIRYGDEIGMGDDLGLNERMSVRTPMQWSSEQNGGFSSAKNTVRPVPDTGMFSASKINVISQLQDSTSLLTWTNRMIRLRKQCPEIGYGSWKIIETGSPNVLALQYNWQNKALIILHNFSKKPQTVTLNADSIGTGQLTNLITSQTVNESADKKYRITLEGYAYFWARSVNK